MEFKHEELEMALLAFIWDRKNAGNSFREIGKAIGLNHHTVKKRFEEYQKIIGDYEEEKKKPFNAREEITSFEIASFNFLDKIRTYGNINPNMNLAISLCFLTPFWMLRESIKEPQDEKKI